MGFASEGLCLILRDYNRPRKRNRVLETGDCVLHQQRVCGTHSPGAERKLMNSPVLVRDESDDKEEI